MPNRSATPRAPRRAVLSVSLAIGLGTSLSAMAIGGPGSRGFHPTTTHTVDTCADDDSPGSLRAIIASANTVAGDTIDLTQLPSMNCSTITLDSSTHTPGHITISQSNLHILGPGSSQLTIQAQLQQGATPSSIFRHTGYQMLTIEGVTIANGKYATSGAAEGGCIYSKGSVTLKDARVENCVVLSSAGNAAGAGIFVKRDVDLDHSTIVYNSAESTAVGGRAYGGGIYAGYNFQAAYSTISGNGTLASTGVGGGAVIAGDTIAISSSTISSNKANKIAGLYFSNALGSAEVTDSTISGNEATGNGGALYAHGVLKLTSSTVAFNHDHYTTAGVSVGGSSLTLESSILAGNSSNNAPADLWIKAGTTIVSGSHNLVVAASGVLMPPATCPQLEPLADNGGATQTHALRHTSPAIDAGDPGTLVFDQTGHARVEGAFADIGAFEWRDGTIEDRMFVSGFDGLCDQ